MLIQDQVNSQLATSVELVWLEVWATTDTKLIDTDLLEYAVSLVLHLSNYAILTIVCEVSLQRYRLLSLEET